MKVFLPPLSDRLNGMIHLHKAHNDVNIFMNKVAIIYTYKKKLLSRANNDKVSSKFYNLNFSY